MQIIFVVMILVLVIMSIMLNIGYEEDEIAIAVINLAHAMGLTVTAEGVETKEQLVFLQEQGCDFVQGYYFSKPIPVGELEELLEKNRKHNF